MDDPYDQMQNMARAISANLVSAIAFFETFRTSGQDKALIDHVNSIGINAGHNAISHSLHEGTILALCRLWDERGDVASIPQAAKRLRRSSFVSAIEAAGHTVDRSLLQSWIGAIKSYIGSIELDALKSLRDRDIAHTSDPNRVYLGKARRLVYGDERKVLEMTIPLVGDLNRLVGYKRWQYSDLQQRWIKEAQGYWAHLVRP
jgi:hypothetical protein